MRRYSSDLPVILPLFNWQEYFYDKIPEAKQQEAREMYEEILSYQGEKDWQERIKRRGTAFFLIIKAWVEYVERSIYVVADVDWNDIPGYKPIVNAIIAELESRDILHHSDSLRQATVSFISNVRLLNQFVRIVFSKTSAFDALAVTRTLDIVT